MLFFLVCCGFAGFFYSVAFYFLGVRHTPIFKLWLALVILSYILLWALTKKWVYYTISAILVAILFFLVGVD